MYYRKNYLDHKWNNKFEKPLKKFIQHGKESLNNDTLQPYKLKFVRSVIAANKLRRRWINFYSKNWCKSFVRFDSVLLRDMCGWTFSLRNVLTVLFTKIDNVISSKTSIPSLITPKSPRLSMISFLIRSFYFERDIFNIIR